MNTQVLSFALREVQRDFRKPLTWLALMGVGIILALAGAFGTGEVLRPLPRIVYWIAVALLTYAAGAFVAALLRKRLADWPQAARIVVIGTATGVAISAVIWTVNAIVFGPVFDTSIEILEFLATIFAITFVISGILDLALTSSAERPLDRSKVALLERLSPNIRSALVAISVEDHYVRVRTTKGEEMVLMRLSDAIKEAGERGLQVHRSHWVALDQVASAARTADRAVLRMQFGPDIPVSRRYVPAIKEAGLLP